MDSLCDVAIQGHSLLADYLRFVGRVRRTGSRGAVEEPVGTVGTALETWRLAPGVVDESRWAVFPRRELLWEDVCRSSRWDVRMAALVAIQNAEVRGQVVDRFIRESVRSFQVPEELACDRAFLGDPADAADVEKMNDFLLRGVGRHPSMADNRSRNIVVRETDPRQWKTSRCWPVRVDWCHSSWDSRFSAFFVVHDWSLGVAGRGIGLPPRSCSHSLRVATAHGAEA